VSRSRSRPLAVFAALIVLVQLATAVAGKSQYLTQLTMAGYYALPIMGLSLLMGYAGQISIGHAGFFAIGGYVSGFLTTCNLTELSSRWWVRTAASLHLLASGQDAFGSPTLVVRAWPASPRCSSPSSLPI